MNRLCPCVFYALWLTPFPICVAAAEVPDAPWGDVLVLCAGVYAAACVLYVLTR